MSTDAAAATVPDAAEPLIPSPAARPKAAKPKVKAAGKSKSKAKARPPQGKRPRDAKAPPAASKAKIASPKANGLARPPAARASYPAGPSAAAAEREAVAVFNALSDPTRFAILRHVVAEGRVNVTRITEHIKMSNPRASQPAISHHLALLRLGGILTPEREGKNNFYSLVPGKLAAAAEFLAGLAAHSGD